MPSSPEIRDIIQKELNNMHLTEWSLSEESDLAVGETEVACVLQNPTEGKEIELRLPMPWLADRAMHRGIGVLIKRAIAAAATT
jgi:hypothetical protein